MTPKSYNKVDGGQSTARVRHVKDGTNATRDRFVRFQIAARLCPDMPGETLDERRAQVLAWAETKAAVEPLADLALLLSALGLDGHTDCPPVDTRVTAFEGVKSPGPRPATATKFPEPTSPPKRVSNLAMTAVLDLVELVEKTSAVTP